MVSVQQKGIKPFSTKRSYIPKQTCNFQLHICLSIYDLHCVKNVQITSFFWSVFSHIWAESREIQSISAFGLNPERYFVSLRIHSECGKIQTRKNSVFGHISHSAFCGHQVLKELKWVLLASFSKHINEQDMQTPENVLTVTEPKYFEDLS